MQKLISHESNISVAKIPETILQVIISIYQHKKYIYIFFFVLDIQEKFKVRPSSTRTRFIKN